MAVPKCLPPFNPILIVGVVLQQRERVTIHCTHCLPRKIIEFLAYIEAFTLRRSPAACCSISIGATDYLSRERSFEGIHHGIEARLTSFSPCGLKLFFLYRP